MRFAPLALLSLALPIAAQQPACGGPPSEPVTVVKVPGNPFQALPTKDGCWVFVSLAAATPGGSPGIGVMHRANGTLTFERALPINGGAAGMALTNDEKILIAAAGPRVAFLDAQKLIAGGGDAVLGYLEEPGVIGRVYANVTPDDAFAFIADERSQSITVIALAKARAEGFGPSSVIGRIPTGTSPIALTFSRDGSLMYATSQRAPDNLNWPISCKREGSADTTLVVSQGAIHVIDMARAKTDPAHAVIHSVPAGCSPVRLVISPTGDRAYVSARNNNSLLVFDAPKLRSDPARSLIARLPVGTAPVGIAVIDGGRRVVVTNSNRFAGDSTDRQALTVVDATKVTAGQAAILGSIPAGAFPREMRVTSDGRVLLLTNFGSSTVQMIDLARLPIQR